MSEAGRTNPRVLADYYRLGRSGLSVSPLCLGTMTFGTEWGWGADEAACRALFERYLDAGGNFVDTADGYTGGRSEEMVGRFVERTSSRDRVVIATKFGFNQEPGNPNAGANGRKNLHHAVEGSLRRLRTDYVDLYWVHAWDCLTPAEELMASLDALVRSGKVRYVGLSNVPAWYLARAHTLAELRGWERACALQLEYSLVERGIEREHLPAARALGLGVCPWSPLAGGLLSGKYRRTGSELTGSGRLQSVKDSPNPAFAKLSERNWGIVDVLADVAREMSRPPAQVALNWVARRPGVVSTIVGATRPEQLDDNLRCLEFEIPEELSRRLDEASRPEPGTPYVFFDTFLQSMIHGGVPVRPGR